MILESYAYNKCKKRKYIEASARYILGTLLRYIFYGKLIWPI